MLLPRTNTLNSIFGESLFDDFFEDFARPLRSSTRYNTSAGVMRTDVRESDAGYELDIEMPGFKKEDIRAELKDGYLTVEAQTTSDRDEKDDKGRYIRRERYFGSCSRSFYVGSAVTQEEITARFEDGILKVTVPKKPAKPEVEESRYIAIEG